LINLLPCVRKNMHPSVQVFK